MEKHILLVTGRFAREAVESAAAPYPVKVYVSDLDVASFLSCESLEKELSGLDLSGYSLIIVPGSVKGSLESISERLGVDVVKGPLNLSEIPLVLDLILNSGLSLSKEDASDGLIAGELREKVSSELLAAYSKRSSFSIAERVFLRTGIMHVVAEIVDAPRLSDEDLVSKAAYYVRSGASVVDLGMVAGEDNSEKIPDMVDLLRKEVGVPLSIDSLKQEEILSAADSGVDLVLSLDHTNYELISSIDIPAAVIPRDAGGVPRDPLERIRLLDSLIAKLEFQGYSRYIIDPVLDPPLLGLNSSLYAFRELRKKYPHAPMLFGAGNVSELLDADSPGVNALLASLASELEADLLFSTEASQKTRGSVWELSTAAAMMFLAKKRRQPPKDLGVDLLRLKDKRHVFSSLRPEEEKLKAISVSARDYALEDCFFRIVVSDVIDVFFYRGKKPSLRFSGKKADDLYLEILSMDLFSGMDHAAYLGKELMKAELALRLGKNYVQDEELF